MKYSLTFLHDGKYDAYYPTRKTTFGRWLGYDKRYIGNLTEIIYARSLNIKSIANYRFDIKDLIKNMKIMVEE